MLLQAEEIRQPSHSSAKGLPKCFVSIAPSSSVRARCLLSGHFCFQYQIGIFTKPMKTVAARRLSLPESLPAAQKEEEARADSSATTTPVSAA